LQILLERNGLRIDDSSAITTAKPLDADSPRMIAAVVGVSFRHNVEYESARPPAPHAPAAAPAIQRQFVNFAFFKIEPAIRQLPDQEKWRLRSEFLKLFQTPWEKMMCLTYSTVGLKADCDFLLWRISATADAFQEQQATLNKSTLGGYLSMPYSLLSMTKRSMYIDKLDPFHTAESRTHIIPGKRKYLFVYPFVKTRDWYLLPLEERQAIMDVHIKVGNKYPSVKLNTTYSFGLGRPGFRRRVRDRGAEGFRRPRDGAARDAEQQVHPARHADLHLRADADGADSRSALLPV
jgi:chlorite dismutase